MAKKPLGPEGARFKKGDWNPQETGAKRTYLDERTALEKRVADLEKVNGITVATVQVETSHLKGGGPHVVRFLVDDATRFEHEFYRHDDKALTKFADELVAREVAVPRSDLLEKLPALKAVAVIKSADGECFVTMPQTGIFRPLLPDLSPVKVGDAIFAVQVDSDLYTRERRSLVEMMKAAMRSAISFRRSSEFTPEQIQELRSTVSKLESENRSLNHKIEKNSQAVQAADDAKKGLGCLLIGGLIGWVVAVGLYLYSDLPVPFFGDDEPASDQAATMPEGSTRTRAELESCVATLMSADWGRTYMTVPRAVYTPKAGDNAVIMSANRQTLRGEDRRVRINSARITRQPRFQNGQRVYTISADISNPTAGASGQAISYVYLYYYLIRDGECTKDYSSEALHYVDIPPGQSRAFSFDIQLAENIPDSPAYIVGFSTNLNANR